MVGVAVRLLVGASGARERERERGGGGGVSCVASLTFVDIVGLGNTTPDLWHPTE